MNYDKMREVVELALKDEGFRREFLKNSEKALAAKNLTLSKEEIERLLSLNEEDYQSSLAGKTVRKRDIQLLSKGPCQVQDVICVCGTGYFYQ